MKLLAIFQEVGGIAEEVVLSDGGFLCKELHKVEMSFPVLLGDSFLWGMPPQDITGHNAPNQVPNSQISLNDIILMQPLTSKHHYVKCIFGFKIFTLPTDNASLN